MAQVSFYGAAGTVTGSKHLVSDGPTKILLDCGLEQGREQSSDQHHLPFDPRTVQAVVISHAHLDHIGLLPVLVRSGFQGSIYSTGATRDLAELILLDAAHLQEQDVAYARRKRWPGFETVQPLYTAVDVPAVMARWQTIPYQFLKPGWTTIATGVTVKLYDAGHILGSAVTVLDIGGQRLAYTGDLGRQQAPLLRDPDPVTDTAPNLILESTYGNRLHHPIESVNDDIVALVQTAIQRNAKIIVPAFSLGRTQGLVYLLHRLTDEGRIPRIPIYVDSPLASRITEVFSVHQRDYDTQSRRDFALPNENPLAFSNLRYTHTVEESKALNAAPGPMMIVSASGMASGGRVTHHLANTLGDERNIVLFTGYQAIGTLGRSIVSGAKRVHLFGQSVPVRAQIAMVNDLSAHADAAELEAYASAIPGLRSLHLVHGEVERASALQQRLLEHQPAWSVTVPQIGQSYPLV